MVGEPPFERLADRLSELWHHGSVQVAVGVATILIGHFLT